jgi:hypothetical protein
MDGPYSNKWVVSQSVKVRRTFSKNLRERYTMLKKRENEEYCERSGVPNCIVGSCCRCGDLTNNFCEGVECYGPHAISDVARFLCNACEEEKGFCQGCGGTRIACPHEYTDEFLKATCPKGDFCGTCRKFAMCRTCRCGRVKYCSKGCQKHDWKRGHRECCSG